jgi:1,4-dihydroxy-2-naphthoate octaprenyltransferase
LLNGLSPRKKFATDAKAQANATKIKAFLSYWLGAISAKAEKLYQLQKEKLCWIFCAVIWILQKVQFINDWKNNVNAHAQRKNSSP